MSPADKAIFTDTSTRHALRRALDEIQQEDRRRTLPARLLAGAFGLGVIIALAYVVSGPIWN